jgi:hypothetical protein
MTELTRRSLAGIWFALAGAIPVVFYFLLMWEGGRNRFDVDLLLLFVGTPVLIAGICGFLLGYSILDPGEIKTSGQAMMRGLLVALLSYLLFFITSALIVAVRNNNEPGFLIGWVVVFIYGFLYVGWLIAVVGVVGGWLLYLYRLKSFDNKEQG